LTKSPFENLMLGRFRCHVGRDGRRATEPAGGDEHSETESKSSHR